MTIEKRARRAIREMAQAPDRGYIREEVLVTFLQAEHDEGFQAGLRTAEELDPQLIQEARDDMRERAADRADGSLLVGSEIAKEIRDLK